MNKEDNHQNFYKLCSSLNTITVIFCLFPNLFDINRLLKKAKHNTNLYGAAEFRIKFSGVITDNRDLQSETNTAITYLSTAIKTLFQLNYIVKLEYRCLHL